MAELNTAELLQQMIDIKNNIREAINTKGVTIVSGMKVYANAIDKIQQNVTLNGVGVDYTQIGWTEDNSEAQNVIDAIVVNEEITKSKQVWDIYKDKEWVFDDSMIGASEYNMFLTKIEGLVYLPVFNLSKVLTTNALFRGNSTLKVCSALNTSSATDMSNMFQDAWALESVGVIDCSSARNIDDMFSGCNSLINIGGLTDLGKGYKYEDGKIHGCELWLNGAPRLTRESLLNIFNSIYDVTVYNVGQFNMFDIYLTADQLSLLSLDDREIATNKGWKLYTAN